MSAFITSLFSPRKRMQALKENIYSYDDPEFIRSARNKFKVVAILLINKYVFLFFVIVKTNIITSSQESRYLDK